MKYEDLIRRDLLSLGFRHVGRLYVNYHTYRADLHDRTINAHLSLTDTTHILDAVSRLVHFSTPEELTLAWIYLSLTPLMETRREK